MSRSTEQSGGVMHYPATKPKPAQGLATRMIHRFLPPIMFGLIVISAYVWIRAGLEPHRQFLMPTFEGLWHEAFGRADFVAELVASALVTLEIAIIGLAVSIIIGVTIGLIMFRSRVMERALSPYLVITQSIPVLAIVPLLQIAFGFGFAPKVLVVVLLTFFSVPTTLLIGLKNVDRGIVDLFRLYGADWFVILYKAGLPSAAPTFFAGLRISASLAVIGAIVSELFFLSGPGGLGQLLINSKIDFRYEQMYAALIVSSALSLGIYHIFSTAERVLFARKT